MEPIDAVSSLLEIKQHNWLDKKTRAMFVEVLLMNTNTMLFTQLLVVFELPAIGGIFTKIEVETSNLYPYRNTLGISILVLQALFILITVVRFISLIITGIRSKCRCFLDRKHVVQLITVAVSVTAVVCHIMRSIRMINALNTLHVEDGFLTSFGEVFLWDQYYSMCVGVITFFAILDLLKALTFNYHIYLMYRTMVVFLFEICQFTATLVVLIFGFSSFIHLLYGTLDSDYKSVSDGVLSLFRMTIGMFKMRHLDEQMEEEGALIIFGIFSGIVTILFINLFISALNYAWKDSKSQIDAGLADFDAELNGYIWKRITNLSMYPARKRPQITDETDGACKINSSEGIAVDFRKGEGKFALFCSTLTKYYVEDSTLEKDMFSKLLASILRKGPNFLWKKTIILNDSIFYTYSKDELAKDTILTMKVTSGQTTTPVDVKCISIQEAARMGLIPYGSNTKPLSQFCIVHREDDAASEVSVSEVQ
ncbi:polycystin-2-like [Pecten maximus]|uniref:polycystin-2-like n=1 Tax=Pecten maximus TaxID=6579 RepID=UPI00145889FF|nr:polycystin-2-like [Pecten maximus]